MAEGSSNNTPPSGDGNPSVRGHLRVIPAPDPLREQLAAPADPTVWSSQDVAAMLRLGDEPPAAEDTADQDSPAVASREVDTPTPTEAPAFEKDNQGIHGTADLGGYEVAYADGSTTPIEPPKRKFLRRGEPEPDAIDHSRLEEAIAVSAVDVWAAHREAPITPESTPRVWEPQPQARDVPLVPAPDRARRRRTPLILLAVPLAVVLAVGVGAVALRGGGRGEVKASHSPKHQAPTPTVSVTAPAQTATTASTTTTALKHPVRKRRKQHHPVKAQKKPIVTTPTTASPTQAYRPVTTTAPVTEHTSSPPPATHASSTPPATHNSSSSSATGGSSAGGLPNAQQVSRFP